MKDFRSSYNWQQKKNNNFLPKKNPLGNSVSGVLVESVLPKKDVFDSLSAFCYDSTLLVDSLNYLERNIINPNLTTKVLLFNGSFGIFIRDILLPNLNGDNYLRFYFDRRRPVVLDILRARQIRVPLELYLGRDYYCNLGFNRDKIYRHDGDSLLIAGIINRMEDL